MTSTGQVARCYTGQLVVGARHMVHDGTNTLVADYEQHCVHMVTNDSRHISHLLTKQKHRVYKPRRVWFDKTHDSLWLGSKEQTKNQIQIIKAKYSFSHITKFNLSTTLLA